MLGLENSPCDAINTALKAPELNNLCNLRVYSPLGSGILLRSNSSILGVVHALARAFMNNAG